MDSVILVGVLLLCRYGIIRVSTDAIDLPQRYTRVIVVLATIIVGASPLILLRWSVIASTWINILIAGLAMTYFAIFLSRILGNFDDDKEIPQ
jgi:uncharacterized protein (DUF983 family)